MDFILERTSLSFGRNYAISRMVEVALGVLPESLMKSFTVRKGARG